MMKVNTEQGELMLDASNDYVPSAPSDDFHKFRLDQSDVLEELHHQLKGEVPVRGADGWEYKQVFERQLTDNGINRVLYIIYSEGLNRNIFLCNLTTDEIKTRCRGVWFEIAKLFTFDSEKYLYDKNMRGILIKSIVHQIHSGLSRSEYGKEAREISTASQRHEIYSMGEKDKGQSKINPLNWFKSK